MKASDIAELLPYATPEERAELEKLLALDATVWLPQPGPQFEAYHCDADILGYGGAAGGGKSDLLAGMVLTAHKRSVIFRREKAQTERITQRMTELLGSTDGLNSQKGIWQFGSGHLLELAGLDNLGDETRWQGRDHDLKAYDEVTEMREAQVRYTMGWNRSSDPKQRVRVVMTFNPPTTDEGQWVVDFFGPWLDPKHPTPAQPGELRWYTTIGGKDQGVPDGRPFVLVDGEMLYDFDPKRYAPEKIIQPRSRTFLPSRVSDNPYYMASGYISTLQGLPEPLRSQMLDGDFRAGVTDNEWQIIPTEWVEAAMKRWQPKDVKGPMDSMGVDVARGGKDNHVIARRHATWFDEPIRHPGSATPNGPTSAAHVMAARRDRSPVHVDIVGWGSSTYDFLVASDVQTIGVNGAHKTEERTKDDTMAFANYRALMYWRMREALDPLNPDPIALPNDPKLKGDLCTPRWRHVLKGILVESKEEVISRLGRSPDDGDAYCMALIATQKDAQATASYAIPNFGAA